MTNQAPSGTVAQFSVAAAERRPDAQGAAAWTPAASRARIVAAADRVYVANVDSTTRSRSTRPTAVAP